MSGSLDSELLAFLGCFDFQISSSPRRSADSDFQISSPAVLIPPRGGTPFADVAAAAASPSNESSSDDDSSSAKGTPPRGGTPEPLLDEVFVAGEPAPPLPPPSPVLPPPPLPAVLLRSAAQGTVLRLLTRPNGPFNGALVAEKKAHAPDSAAMAPQQTAQLAAQCIVIGKFLLRKGDPPAPLLFTAGAASGPPAPRRSKGHRYRSALWLSCEDASNFDAKGEYIGEGEPVEAPNAAAAATPTKARAVDGCSCSRSHCTSRHCECKKAGRRCDPRKCMCQGCENCAVKKSGARARKGKRAGKRKAAPV